MITTNKKLAKEIRSILTSASNARRLAEQEIEKIDAKYKALAEKEKSDLSKAIKMLDTQIASYRSIIEDDTQQDENDEPAVEQEKEQEKEQEIIDTVFEENNTEKMGTDDNAEASVESAENAPVSDEGDGDVEWPSDDSEETKDTVDVVTEDKDDDDEWPDEPEEWN